MRVGKGYISPGSASPGHDEMPNISQKALSEMLQRLHQDCGFAATIVSKEFRV